MYTPQRLFGEVGSSTNILNHEPFLERARLQREQERNDGARLALGGYIVARLVDKLLTIDGDAEAAEGFHWQLGAVRRHVDDLPANSPETSHLSGIVSAALIEGRPSTSLGKHLTAYACFLEHEGRLEESLEILALAARSDGPQLVPAEFVRYALLGGRLNRLLARWEAAQACYRAAEESALSLGDLRSAFRSQLGSASALRGQGNLPQARSAVERVIKDAADHNFADVRSDAFLDLGAVLMLQGLDLEALQAVYQAFVLAPDDSQQMRILGELGVKLLKVGALEGARVAFEIVVASNTGFHVRTNALLELIELESAVGNRVGFERLRQEAAICRGNMAPSTAIDYAYKSGIGMMRFQQSDRGREFLTEALQLAERHRLHEWYFRVERALHELEAGSDAQRAPAPAGAGDTPAVQQMTAHLREYALTAGV